MKTNEVKFALSPRQLKEFEEWCIHYLRSPSSLARMIVAQWLRKQKGGRK